VGCTSSKLIPKNAQKANLGGCHRSCSEVLYIFQHLASATDFEKEASSWPSVQIDPTESSKTMPPAYCHSIGRDSAHGPVLGMSARLSNPSAVVA
jgi:hypothetical protein